MKNNDNKKISITLIVLGIIISFFGGSLAYWNWETSTAQRTLVSVQVQGATLTITGENIEHTGMYPTNDCDGEGALIGEVATATAVNGTNSDMETIIKLRATLSVKQGSLNTDKKSKLKWAIVDTSTSSTCDTTPYRGTLADVSTNTDIDTGIRFTATKKATTSKSYRLYVWLDSSYTHTNVGDVVSDPMQDLDISIKYSPASELSQESAYTIRPNAPVLDAGMIPVTIANNGTVTTVSQTDSAWYNYDNKEWANVVLVKESGTQTRSYYKTNTGVTVAEDDILAYYVWIPRYKYRIISPVTCSEVYNPTVNTHPECYMYNISEAEAENIVMWWYNAIVSSNSSYTIEQAISDLNTLSETGSITLGEGADALTITREEVITLYDTDTGSNVMDTATIVDDKITFGPNTIDIVFEEKNNSVSTGDAKTTYYTHPAFIWGGNTIAGFWVGKFETTGDITTPTILPNTPSMKNNTIEQQFTTTLTFAGGVRSGNNITFAGNNTYGLVSSTDSHMMKNSEWGAVAYLSHSQYGINSEVRINNNSNYITGCGASEENGSSTSECQIAYGSGVTSYPQSTTGNMTGIFDMSGGKQEYVMGWFGLNESSYTFSFFITNLDSKYYDLYPSNHFNEIGEEKNILLCTLEYCGGHALDETLDWYSDYHIFLYSSGKFALRGGSYDDNKIAGLFASRDKNGESSSFYGFRSVAIIGV